MKKGLLISIFTLLIATLFAQDVRFEAKADARQVLLGKHFQVSFTLHDAEGSRFKSPDFSDFEVLQGPVFNESSVYINGKGSKSIGYSYVLRPKKIGKAKIGSATIKANGKTYKTKSITVEVLKAKHSNAKTQDDLKSEVNDVVFVRAEFDKEKAYVGEQVVVDFKIYTSVGIRHYEATVEPEFEGFFAKDILAYDTDVTQEVYNGKQYSTRIIRRIALFPQKAGQLEVEPMELDVRLNGDFNPFFANSSRHQIRSEVKTIEIEPLPTPTPSFFTGAVGEYLMFSQINKKVATTDDNFILRMTVRGDGDIKRVTPPILDLPKDSFEIYEPQVKESTFEKKGKLYNEKVIEYLILPKEKGIYNFTPAFTYFHTDSLKYSTIYSTPITLKVAKGSDTPDVVTSNNFLELRPNRSTTRLKSTKSSFLGTIPFWILFSLPFLGLLYGGFKKYQLSKIGEVDKILLKKQKANQVAQKRLEKATIHQKANESRKFYDEISHTLWGYVSDKLNIPTSELSKSNATIKLSNLGVNKDDVHRFLQCIQNCEMALFAGMDNADAMQSTYDDALGLIANIEQVGLSVE